MVKYVTSLEQLCVSVSIDMIKVTLYSSEFHNVFLVDHVAVHFNFICWQWQEMVGITDAIMVYTGPCHTINVII